MYVSIFGCVYICMYVCKVTDPFMYVCRRIERRDLRRWEKSYRGWRCFLLLLSESSATIPDPRRRYHILYIYVCMYVCIYFSIDAYMHTICVRRCPTWRNRKPLWKYVAGSSLLTCTRTRGGSSRESPQVNTTYIYIHIHTYTFIHPRINSLDTYIRIESHFYRMIISIYF